MKIPEYIYHYYEKANGPFLNLTTLPKNEAKRILSNLKGFNSNRPENYYDLRLEHELRLKEIFVQKGGETKRNDPYYFTLGECDWIKSWYVNPGVVRIKIASIKNFNSMSLTYTDSMVSFQLAEDDRLEIHRKPCHGKVYMLDEIYEVIEKYGMPSENKWRNNKEDFYDRFIELQMWNDDFLKYIDSNTL